MSNIGTDLYISAGSQKTDSGVSIIISLNITAFSTIENQWSQG